MHILENKYIKISVKSLGAELSSLYHKYADLEYMWQANPAFWGKTSPVLFPIVGGLKDNSYVYKGQKYTLPRHGFAREMQFELEHETETELCFLLKSDSDTIKNYPFDFEFRVMYSIVDEEVSIVYEIANMGNSEMYFSLGAHPAFNVPLLPGLKYEDYQLSFNSDTLLRSYPLTQEGLVKDTPFTIDLDEEGTLKLKKELFHADALVFKDLQSSEITLHSDASLHGLRMHFEGFPFYGIWAAKDADFICLEPWCGIADIESTGQDLVYKEGIMSLEAGGVFEVGWSVEVW
jgi:galactose mutarotase-like enzyme